MAQATVCWVNDLDSGESQEVVRIERENVRDSVNMHYGNQAGIKGSSTRDAVCLDEANTFCQNRRSVVEDREQLKDFSTLIRRPSNRPAESLGRDWASCYRPEFEHILGSNANLLSLCTKTGHGIPSDHVLWRSGIDEAQQEVRIRQVGGLPLEL